MRDTVAIVTGASSGIGRATAIRLASDFAVVVLVARDRDKLEAAAALVRDQGAQAHVIDADLSAPEAAHQVVTNVFSTFGRIDALVNVAGAVPGLDLFEMTDAQWDAGLALKFHGARRMAIAAWDALKASGGSIIFMSGNSAEAPVAAQAAIGAINAAISALAKAFADRGRRDGIQVNSVSPGSVMTGRRQGMIEKWAAANQLSVEEAQKRMLEKTGIARYGEPEEIAELIAYLLSPKAHWLSGTQLRMDGGELASV